jgi:hypothetical protein
LVYTVSDTSQRGVKGCDGPYVELEELPFLSNRICSLPEDFMAIVEKGSVVAVTGNGTRFGIFPDRLRILDAEN